MVPFLFFCSLVHFDHSGHKNFTHTQTHSKKKKLHACILFVWPLYVPQYFLDHHHHHHHHSRSLNLLKFFVVVFVYRLPSPNNSSIAIVHNNLIGDVFFFFFTLLHDGSVFIYGFFFFSTFFFVEEVFSSSLSLSLAHRRHYHIRFEFFFWLIQFHYHYQTIYDIYEYYNQQSACDISIWLRCNQKKKNEKMKFIYERNLWSTMDNGAQTLTTTTTSFVPPLSCHSSFFSQCFEEDEIFFFLY